jgi:RND family efflux transporter MFP subunit
MREYVLAAVLLAGGVSSADTGQWAAGITEPILDVTMSAQAAGTVSKRCFQEGDFAKQGQVILELDKKIEELTVDRRKAVMDTLKNDVERTRHLLNTMKSESKEDLEKKELDHRVAVVDYDTAVELLRRRHVVAPFDGYIVEYFFEAGEDCRAQEPVVRLVDTRRCYFVSNVEAKAGYSLKVGQEVKLELEAGATPVNVVGKIIYVSPVVDPASGLLKIKVLFDNPNGQIRPGVAGKMQLTPLSDAR